MNGTLSEINARLPVSANTKQLLSLCMLMFPCFSFSLESSKILWGPRLMISYKHLEDSLLLSYLRVTSGCRNVHLVSFFALKNLIDETQSIDYSIELAGIHWTHVMEVHASSKLPYWPGQHSRDGKCASISVITLAYQTNILESRVYCI